MAGSPAQLVPRSSRPTAQMGLYGVRVGMLYWVWVFFCKKLKTFKDIYIYLMMDNIYQGLNYLSLEVLKAIEVGASYYSFFREIKLLAQCYIV